MQPIHIPIPLQCVIFDLDGTLSNSASMWTDIWSEIFSERDIDAPPIIYDQVRTMTIEKAAEHVVDSLSLDYSAEEFTQILVDEARHRYETSITMKPGAVEYLQQLNGRGVPLCIASASKTPLFYPLLERYGIQDAFDSIVCCEEVGGRTKAYPDIYLHCAEIYSLSPAECVVFEDSPLAVNTAHTAGFYTLAVADESNAHLRDEIRQICDQLVESYEQLL